MATQTYILNGSTQFEFPHPVRTKDSLNLQIVGGDTVPFGAWTVDGLGPNNPGVTITWPGAPTDGSQLQITRTTLLERVTDFTADGVVRTKPLDDEFNNVFQFLEDSSFTFGFDPPVLWQPALDVVAFETTVIYDNGLYYALQAHTTGATFEEDADKWQFVTDLTSLIQSKLLQELVVSVPYALPPLDPVFSFVPAHTIDVDNAFSLWRGNAIDVATTDTVLSMQRDGTEIGTITFPAGVATPVFASTGTPPPRHQFNTGERFSIMGPDLADATLAGITLTMPFNLVTLP